MQSRFAASIVAVAVFAAALAAGASGITADARRTISLYNIHTKETLTSTYKVNGKFVPAEMEKINWILRDWRKNEATTMDPQLIDLLWEVHSELGSAEPIHIISGFRSRGTNDMLRKSVGGQASQSRHILGKAADVHFPDVPVKNLRYSALIREKGGVGYYPTSAIPFVHMDIDRVRAWPRLPRAELALLFPSGHTQHVPADGVPITRDDVREARAANKDLAVQLAAFHDLRARPKLPIQTASLTPSLPKLLGAPRPAERPGLGTMASDEDRARMAALIAADPPPQLLTPPTPVSRRASASTRRRAGRSLRPLGRSPEAGRAPLSRTQRRAGARVRRRASRRALLPAIPDRALPDRHRLRGRSRRCRAWCIPTSPRSSIRWTRTTSPRPCGCVRACMPPSACGRSSSRARPSICRACSTPIDARGRPAQPQGCHAASIDWTSQAPARHRPRDTLERQLWRN